jgi:hypothetical protein
MQHLYYFEFKFMDTPCPAEQGSDMVSRDGDESMAMPSLKGGS